MSRKLKGYIVNTNMNLTDENFFNITKHINFTLCDLLFSILSDKKLNSTEKSILGLILENSLSSKSYMDYGDGDECEVNSMVLNITCYKNSVLEVPHNITTDFLASSLRTSKRTIFNNLYSLIEKNIISFGREGFSEYGKIRINIGYVVSEYYK